jgi:hypothetical protein
MNTKIYAEILTHIVENGLLELNCKEELEEAVWFEARERGLADEEIEEAIEFAIDHYKF